MAWRYCSCESELEAPNLEEALAGELQCSACGRFYEIGECERNEVIYDKFAEIADRVTSLEEQIHGTSSSS